MARQRHNRKGRGAVRCRAWGSARRRRGMPGKKQKAEVRGGRGLRRAAMGKKIRYQSWAPRPFAGKVEKRRGGIKGPQARAGGSSGSPLASLLFKPPKKHREGPGKGANKQNSKKRKLQEYGEMRTSEAFSSGCCSSIGYLGIFAKERRPQRSLRPPRPSDRALSVSLLRMRLLQA